MATLNLLPIQYEALEAYINEIGQIVNVEEPAYYRLYLHIRVNRLEFDRIRSCLPTGHNVRLDSISIRQTGEYTSTDIEFEIWSSGSMDHSRDFALEDLSLHA